MNLGRNRARVLKQTFMFIFHLSVLLCSGQSLILTEMADGYSKPVDICNTGIPDDLRLFIVEKDGRIKILNADGTKLALPFLDIDARVNSLATERGLLGMAFHPEYKTNGYFFVSYINAAGHTTIARFRRSAENPNVAEPTSEKTILIVTQPFNNHNAGDLAFGPDGYLYIPLGDGGNAGDPGNRSQNPKEFLGKLLRIDINTETQPYKVPEDNPYAGRADTLPEIWALGLRNPWRFSYDAVDKNWWIADVGQDKWEEINLLPGSVKKANFGWRCYEGLERFQFSGCNDARNYYKPVHVYDNRFDVGCSITGGYVYRGSKYPFMQGQYVYADYCTGKFWSLSRQAGDIWSSKELADLDNQEFSSFGTDSNQELYACGYGSGNIYKLTFQEPSLTEEITLSHENVEVYPNPANQFIRISHKDIHKVKTNWQLYTQNGISICIPSVIQKDDVTIEFDTALLPPGMYLLRNTSLPGFSKWISIK